MKKSLVEIYALAVCFVTLMCFAVALGIGVYNIFEIVNPELTLGAYEYHNHQTNEAFTRNWKKDRKRPDESEITRMREESYKIALQTEKRDGMQSFVRAMIIVVIDIVIFLIHWGLARRSRKAYAT